MVISLTPEQEVYLAKIAEHRGQSPEAYATETLQHLIECDEQDAELLLERVRQADLGVFLTAEEMNQRFQKMMTRA